MRIIVAVIVAFALSGCVAEPGPGYYGAYYAAPGYYGPGIYDRPFLGSSIGLGFYGGGPRVYRHHHFHHHRLGGFHHGGARGFHHHRNFGRSHGGWHEHAQH